MPETVNLLTFGFYGKKRADGTWEAAPPDCGKRVRHSMGCAEKAVERDAVLKGTLADLQNVPAQYKVSKEAGLDEFGGRRDGPMRGGRRVGVSPSARGD